MSRGDFMIKLIFIFLACIIAAVGISEIVGWFMRKFIYPPSFSDLYCLLPITANMKTPELTISWMYFNMTWDAGTYQGLILLDLGADDDTLEICRQLCLKNDGMYLCKPEQLGSMLAR